MSQPVSRWSVVIAYALLAGATQLLWLTYAPVTTVAAMHFGVSVGAVGWLAQVFPLLYVVLALPTGIALDRWFRASLAVGALLTALGALGRLVGDDFGWALAGQTLIAVAQPLVLNAINKVAGGYLRESDRPLGIAVASAGTFAGMLLALGLGAVLSAPDQVHTLVLAGTAASVLSALYLLWALRTPVQHAMAAVASGPAALRVAWGERRIRVLCAVVFAGFGVFIALTTWLEALLAPAGVTATGAGVLLLAMVVIGIVGAVVLPPWAARNRRERGVLRLAGLVAGAGCLLLAVLPGLVTGFVALVPTGLVLLAAMPVVLELAERAGSGAGGTSAALIWLSGNAGGLVVALVAQLLLDRPASVFVLLALVGLAAVPLAGLLRPTATQEPAPAS